MRKIRLAYLDSVESPINLSKLMISHFENITNDATLKYRNILINKILKSSLNLMWSLHANLYFQNCQLVPP